MIRVQEATTAGESSARRRFLVGSDCDDPAEARREIAVWMRENRCRVSSQARRLSVFDGGSLVRERVLVEAEPPAAIAPIRFLFSRLRFALPFLRPVPTA